MPDPTDLAQLSRVTVDYYQARADDFEAGTRDHDVRQNIDTLLGAIEGMPPFTVLDLGCGPGRDLRTFTALGHRAIGLDATPRFLELARTTGCEVWQQDLYALDLPAAVFDGIFANAVLFHVPREILPRVLGELLRALKPRGVLFSSNPRGDNEAGVKHGRFGVFHDLAAWRRYLEDAGFEEITHYYRPAGLPRGQQPWLASAWRRSRRSGSEL
jgi:SAM-dependent methyltransferase